MGVERRDVEVGGIPVTTLVIDRPPVNVLDMELCEALAGAVRAIARDGESRVVVLRGAGRGFSAGVDIGQHTPELMPKLLPAFHDVFRALLALDAITVAAVHGLCLGGAAELALACDRVLAEREAKIGFPEIKVGCYPPVAIPLLVSRVGPGRALAAIASGEPVPVDTLAEWGLIDAVVEPGGLDVAIGRELERYAGKSPAVLGMIAGLMHREAERGWGDRIDAVERAYLTGVLHHPDASEGIRAFQEKRAPRWRKR